MPQLATSSNSVQIQAFSLSENHVNITGGVFLKAVGFHCVADGVVSITWPSGPQDITCVEGDDYTVVGHSQIEITSGTFHVM